MLRRGWEKRHFKPSAVCISIVFLHKRKKKELDILSENIRWYMVLFNGEFFAVGANGDMCMAYIESWCWMRYSPLDSGNTSSDLAWEQDKVRNTPTRLNISRSTMRPLHAGNSFDKIPHQSCVPPEVRSLSISNDARPAVLVCHHHYQHITIDPALMRPLPLFLIVTPPPSPRTPLS